MATFLRGNGQVLWDVTVDTGYVQPMNFLAPRTRDMFDANNKAVDYLFRALCQPEFDRVYTESLACRILSVSKEAHVRNTQVQAQMYATYRREYENFTHLPGESIDALFQRFTVVVNNKRANVDVLPYDYHDRVVKLLHLLDCTVWGGKFEAIVELERYDTQTVNELFSKLKSAEVDRGMTAKIEGPTDSHSIALIGGSKGKSNTNPSTRMFSLSSLMSVLDEEFDVLGEDELALLMRRFERLHDNWVNMRRNTRTASCVASQNTSSLTAPRRSRTRTTTSTSTGQGAITTTSTRASTRTCDDRGRRRAEAWPERWFERATSTPVLRTPPRARAVVKMMVIGARGRSRPRT
jgi:hypothetical protein